MYHRINLASVAVQVLLSFATNEVVSMAGSLDVNIARDHIRIHAQGFLGRVSTFRNASDASDEAKAQDLFVRRCTVGLSVTEKYLLPTAALEKFCGETDAAEVCRLEIENEAKAVNRRGGSTQLFCLVTYKWFQRKYGMFCPLQCDKFQCHATCVWLEDKQSLDKRRDQLQGRLDRVKSDEGNVLQAEERVNKMKDELSQLTDTIEKTNVILKRSKLRYEDAQAAVAFEQSRLAKLDAEVTKYTNGIGSLTTTISTEQDYIKQVEREHDLKKLEMAKVSRQLDAIKKQVSKQTVDLREERERDAKKSKDIIDMRKVGKKLEDDLNSKREVYEDKAKIAEAALKKEQDANEKLVVELDKVSKKYEGSEDLVKRQADLNEADSIYGSNYREMKKRLRQATLDHDAARRAVKKAKILLESNAKEIGTMEQEHAQIITGIQKIEKEIEQQNPELEKLSKQKADLDKWLTQDNERLMKLQDDLGDTKLEMQKKSTALGITKQAWEEQLEIVNKEKAKESKAKLAVDAASATLEKAREKLLVVPSNIEREEAVATAMRTQWLYSFGNASKNLEANSNATKELVSRTPEVVRQHGLGFVQILGGM